MVTTPKTLWTEGASVIYDDASLDYDDPDTPYDGIGQQPPLNLWEESPAAQDALDTWDDVTAPISDPWDSATDTWDSILNS